MSLSPSPDLDLVDRKYLSQFSTEQVGLVVANAGGPLDPDANAVTVAMVSDLPGSAVVFSRPAERLDLGTYATTLTSADTDIPGPYSVVFTYLVGGVADRYSLSCQVGSSAPAYDSLPPGMKMIVESVWIRFADLYDAPYGGPHLQVYMQSHFGRNRVAQLLGQAIGRLNTISQPHQTYTLTKVFPFANWGPLLVQALYVEVLKHLRRSYVEQPEVILGTTVSRFDRRDYMSRWGEILAEETGDLKEMLDSFKIAHMGFGSPHVLVSGGAYGNYGPVAMLGGGLGAARGYFFGSRMR